VEALVAQQKSIAAQVGAPVDLFVEAIHRSLDVRDGRSYLRPSPAGVGGDMMAAVDECDMLTRYQQVRCPLLVVAGTRPEANYGDAAVGLAWIHELVAAFRKGVARDLAKLAAEQSNVRFEAVDGSHALPFEQPRLVADLVLDFLSTARAASDRRRAAVRRPSATP
jgi:pimeloyl-ACP methyl ester carboxylesterase